MARRRGWNNRARKAFCEEETPLLTSCGTAPPESGKMENAEERGSEGGGKGAAEEMTYQVVFRLLGADASSSLPAFPGGTRSVLGDSRDSGVSTTRRTSKERPTTPTGSTVQDSSVDRNASCAPAKEYCSEKEEEGMLLNDMSAELRQAFLLRLQLERVVFRTLSWKARGMALLGVAGGLLWVYLQSWA
jgi:hypothetical protein